VSQFICHINTVMYRTVHFSMNTVPDVQCSLVHNNTTVYLYISLVPCFFLNCKANARV